jgi:hypothetical protein
MADFSFIGKGKVYLGPFGGAGALRPVGNCSKLTLGIDEETKKILDYMSAGGGVAAKMSRISGLTVTMSLREFTAENVALAVYGESTPVTAGTISSHEAHTAYKGGLIRLLHVNPSAVVVNATNGTIETVSLGNGGTGYTVNDVLTVVHSGAALGTVRVDTVNAGVILTITRIAKGTGYTVANGKAVTGGTGSNATINVLTINGPRTITTDYLVVPGGIFITEAGAIADAEAITVDYAYTAQNVIQAIVESAQEFVMAFDGLNEAQTGLPVIVDMFRIKFGPTKALDMIEDDFGTLELTGELLIDDTKTGTGISQYFKYTFIEA